MSFPDLTQYFQGPIASALGTRFTKIEPFKSGSTQSAFLISDGTRALVARIEEPPAARLNRSLIAQQRAAAAGVPTPKIIAHSLNGASAGELCWVVEEYVPGSEFTSGKTDRATMLGACADLGRFLRRLHSIETDGFGALRSERLDAEYGTLAKWLAAHERDIETAVNLAGIERADLSPITAAYRLLRETYAESPRLCHGDFAGENILVNEGRLVAMIDWGGAFGGDPAFDVAYFHFWSRDAEYLDALLSAYQPEDGEAFRRRVLAYLVFIIVDLNVYLSEPRSEAHAELLRDARSQLRRILETPPGLPWQTYVRAVAEPLANKLSPAPGEVEQVKQELLGLARANLTTIPSAFFERRREAVVTIVMLSHGRLERTLSAIESLREHVTIPFKLLLIDNGSGEEVQERLRAAVAGADFIQLICLAENLGCAGGRAFALDYVETEYVMFIDNDIEVFPGTVEHLLYRLESAPEIVAAAGNVILPSGLVHLCGGDYEPRDGVLNYELLGWGKRFDDPSVGQTGRCKWVNGGLTMLRKDLLLGHPYDLSMEGYYEDLEWCYRLNQQGRGNFLRVVEAVGLHYHEPKHEVLTLDATQPEAHQPTQAVKCVEAIAHFYRVHGLIIQNLFDFLPELGPPTSPLHLSASAIILTLINRHGGQWLIEQWRQGQPFIDRLAAPAESAQSIPIEDADSAPRQAHLSWLIVQILQQSALIKQYSAQVIERDSHIAGLNGQLAEKEQKIAALMAEVDELQRHNSSLAAFAREQRRAIEAIEGSKAFMLTRALWALRRRFKLRHPPSVSAAPPRSLQPATMTTESAVINGHVLAEPSEPMAVNGLSRAVSNNTEASAASRATDLSLTNSSTKVEAPQLLAYPATAKATNGASAEPSQSLPRAGSYDLICFPVIDWEFRFQRPQQLATELARLGRRVFYLRTTFHQSGPRVICQKIAENVYNVQLPGSAELSLYKHRLDQSALEEFMRAFELFRQEAGIGVAISMVQLPFWSPLADEMRRLWGWKVVYDCMDEHSGFSTNTSDMLRQEEELIESSDLVIATARLLHEKVSTRATRTLLLPNATDFDHFNQPGSARVLPQVSGPIIGYYGAISDWFDIEMVRSAAAARPDWQFVLIGSTFGANIAPLQSLPNVRLLGEQPYSILPSYLARFDVACIPFLRIPLTEATNPVKFYEYLSAGKPVVAVDLPELRPYADYFYPVKSCADFVPQIEAALRESSPEAAQRRIEFAREQTWRARCQSLDAALRRLHGKAAIIIVSYNNLDYLKLCLESVWAKTEYPNYEVIVVDNGSQPEVIDYLAASAKREPRLKVVLNGVNLGFAAANNIGVREAGECDYVVLLNNDTVVTRDWLNKMINYLDKNEVGLVGPVTNNIGNEARINVDYQRIEDVDAFAARYAREHAGECFDISMLAMFCVGMRKDLFDRVGWLDERFGVGMFEDDDYSLRVRQAGYRIVCAEDIFIHHWGGASFKKLDQEHYRKIFEENLDKFETKWGRKWQPHKYRPGVTV